MPCLRTRMRPALLALVVLLLSCISCNAKMTMDEFPNDVVDRILGSLAESKAQDIGDFTKMRSLFQWHGQMNLLSHSVPQLFSSEATVARWLANVPCTHIGPIRARYVIPEIIYYRDRRPCSFWECMSDCLRVENAWPDSSASMLSNLLKARWLWTKTSALLSVSQRSWSLMDATDLGKLFQPEAQARLPRCASGPLFPRPDGRGSTLEYSAGGLLETMASNLPNLGIEQLHIDLDNGGFQSSFWDEEPYSPLRNVLPRGSFKELAVLLVSAPHLRDVSISWDTALASRQATSETVHLVEAIAAILANNPSVKKLSIMRTCHIPLLGSGPEPLDAFIRASNIGGGWRNVESLTLLKHHCDERAVRLTHELRALPLLAARMPALRRVHLEFNDRDLIDRPFPALGDFKQLVRNHVVVTVASNHAGCAGVARAATLAPLRDTLSDGYAMVISASDMINLRMPTTQIRLVGEEALRDTTALTIVPTNVTEATRGGGTIESQSLETFFVELVPRLERLAIDSRWTESFSNKYFAALPLQIAGRLRALLLHTIAFVWDGENCAACEALERLLQAGHDISVVDLGIALPSPFGRKDAVILENIAFTLRRMPLLEEMSLTLAIAGNVVDYRISVLRARFLDILPFARVSVSLIAPGPRAMEQEIDRNGLSTAWRLNISAPVPPSPAFPSPRQLFEKALVWRLV